MMCVAVVCLCFVDPLTITSLKQYTSYKVRLAAVNAVGMGQFSSTNTVRTQGLCKFYADRPQNSNTLQIHTSCYGWDSNSIYVCPHVCIYIFALCING